MEERLHIKAPKGFKAKILKVVKSQEMSRFIREAVEEKLKKIKA